MNSTDLWWLRAMTALALVCAVCVEILIFTDDAYRTGLLYVCALGLTGLCGLICGVGACLLARDAWRKRRKADGA